LDDNASKLEYRIHQSLVNFEFFAAMNLKPTYPEIAYEI